MSSYTIIRATADSPQLLRSLNRVFGEVFGDHETYQRHPPHDDYVQRLLANPLFVALAAVENDQVVGALAAYELPKFEQERSEFYLYDLAVVESARRKGIATALIHELQSIARSRNGWVVFVQADQQPEDEPAIALYSRLGIREEVLHFDLPLDFPPRSGE